MRGTGLLTRGRLLLNRSSHLRSDRFSRTLRRLQLRGSGGFKPPSRASLANKQFVKDPVAVSATLESIADRNSAVAADANQAAGEFVLVNNGSS
jgi:hypothetical protein